MSLKDFQSPQNPKMHVQANRPEDGYQTNNIPRIDWKIRMINNEAPDGCDHHHMLSFLWII